MPVYVYFCVPGQKGSVDVFFFSAIFTPLFISVLIYQDHFMVFSFVIAMHFASKEIQAFAEISLKLYAMASSC